MPLLAIGSVAFDHITTPYGQQNGILGGSATYFSVTASYFAPVRIVAVVGEDFGQNEMRIFEGRAIDTSGLERVPGRTFRWRGEYSGDMSQARTLETQLNVFETFATKIPPAFLDSQFLFLGNIAPALQLHVRRQLPGVRLVACDTMNFWIKGWPDDLRKTLEVVDVLVINESEARMLSGTENLRRTADSILKMGPSTLIIKRGEHGACLFQNGSIFFSPAYPLEQVHDPTGAGDTFAGGFMGYLAKVGDFSETHLRRALVYGSVMASFSVEEFGLSRLLRVTHAEVEERFQEFKKMTHFDV